MRFLGGGDFVGCGFHGASGSSTKRATHNCTSPSGPRRLDQIIASARDGKRFTPRELLSVQLEVFRITEELSLVNKVVEQGMAGIKRLWNLQV